MRNNRRHFLMLAASSPLLLTAGCQSRPKNTGKAHVVIIGGGFAGATAAKTIKQLAPTIDVSLIEKKPHYVTCPASNWVLGGFKAMHSLAVSYQQLADRYAVNVMHDTATLIDPQKQTVQLMQGTCLHYDRLIVSPGISFKKHSIDDIPGLETTMPHAWHGGEQIRLLQSQVKAMPENGRIIICIPGNPYRCPPGPYERASLLAWYCQHYKPKAKIILLDQKRAFSKQALFEQAWRKHYGYGENGMIEWHSITDNPIVNINTEKKHLHTDFGDTFKADVINYIPVQQAGSIAHSTGLVDESGWCPVNALTSESQLQANIHVIGDAARMEPLPKSAFAANSQAKTCAFAVISLLNDQPLLNPLWMNTCYSLVSQHQAISVAMVYKTDASGNVVHVEGAGGVSRHTDKYSLQREAHYARNWYQSIILDSFL